MRGYGAAMSILGRNNLGHKLPVRFSSRLTDV